MTMGSRPPPPLCRNSLTVPFSSAAVAAAASGVSQELLVPSRTATTRKVVHEELALQWVVASGKSRELALANPW